MNEVLPRPEKLNGTRSCELAALLVTMGFTPADNQMSVATGTGVPGGTLGYWRFLPAHPAQRYVLRAVLSRGLDPYQASKLPARQLPVYPEQAYIAAAFHNFRMLVESVVHGTRLRLVACAWQACPELQARYGPVHVFERVEAQAAPEMPGADALRAWRAAGTRNTELAAALATLGFEPGNVGTRVAHEARGHVWLFPAISMGGHWQLAERMARWADDAWCAQDGNTDPIAAMADGFWNLRHLRRSLKDARVYVQAQNGQRTVLVRRDASAKTWQRAEDFLTR